MADSIDSGNTKPRSGGPTRGRERSGGRERSETGNDDVLPQRPTGGPRTPAGKARSSLNALKHGRYAKSASVISIEDQVAFQDLIQAYNTQFTPNTAVEARLVNEIAHIDWQLTRWRAIEIAQINRTYDLHDPQFTGIDSGLDQIQILTAALESSVNESRFPAFINNRINRLLTERNSAIRTLRSLRRTNPAAGPQPLQPSSDNNIFIRPHTPPADFDPIENTTTCPPIQPPETN